MTVTLHAHEPPPARTLAGMHVHVLGSGPPVLFLHGSGPGTTAWGAWSGLVRGSALDERFAIVAPDQAGFGRTPLVGGPSDATGHRARWTAQAIALMEGLGIERYAVVGHSAGGAVALSLAAARPQAVRAVVGIGCMGAPMSLPAGLDRLWAARPTEAGAREVLELIAPDGAPPIEPEAVEARLDAMAAQGGYAALFPAPRRRWLDDLTLTAEERDAVRAPVLLVHGARDRIVPLRDAALPLAEHLPDARLHVLGRCGHSPHAEARDAVAHLIADFLEAPRA